MLQAAQSEGDLLGLRGSAMLMGLGFGFHVCGIAFCLLALGLAVGRERWPGFGVVALGWRNCRLGGGGLALERLPVRQNGPGIISGCSETRNLKSCGLRMRRSL